MRVFVLRGAFFLLAAAIAVPSPADEAAVKKMIGDYATAFNAKDLDGVLSYWAEHGVHVDRETGERTEGRDAIREDISEAFELDPGARLLGRVDRLRFIKPDVASVEGQVSITAEGDDPALTDFSAILVDHDGTWKIDSIEESTTPLPATSYDALRELDWLVGRWSDESESGRIDNAFRWSENGAFLIRSFSAELDGGDSHSGTQVIGWDPRSLEIRSWTFNSDGSFGDATWSKNGEDWLIKSSQTLSDGQAASGTFILSRGGDDEMTMQLIGHEVEGEPRPAERSVTVVRVSDEVSAASPDATNPIVVKEAASDDQKN